MGKKTHKLKKRTEFVSWRDFCTAWKEKYSFVTEHVFQISFKNIYALYDHYI
jgi:hypothetical protein